MTKAIKYEPAIAPLDFSRGSTGTYFDNLGVLQTAGVDEARLTHDPVTGDPEGLLIEEQRTNLNPWSEDISNWNSEGVTFSTSEGHSAYFETPVDENHSVQIPYSASDGQDYSRWAVVKPIGRRYVLASYRGFTNIAPSGSLGGNWNVFDYQTESWLEPNSEWFAEKMPSGFWKLGISRSAVNADSNKLGFSANDTGDASKSFLGDPNKGLIVAYSQYEQGSFPTSYIKTEGSQVTRSADNCSRTLGSEFNASEGTIYAEIKYPHEKGFTFGRASALIFKFFNNNSQFTNQFVAGRGGNAFSDRLNFRIRDLSGSGYDADFGNKSDQLLPKDQVNKVAISCKAGVEVSYAVNGVVYTEATPSLPAINWTGLSLSTAYDGSTLVGCQRNTRYFPRALSATELQELTA